MILKHSHNFSRLPAQQQKGFSLIELLIAITINLLIVIAASYLYLGTSETRKAQADRQEVTENGLYAINLVGRDLINAGFYPTIRSSSPTLNSATLQLTIDKYFNPVAATPAPYDSGLFGCQGKKFDPLVSKNSCESHSNAAIVADTVTVNYFTNDAFNGDLGQRKDCAGQDVKNSPTNTSRLGTTATATVTKVPALPMFVSNSYTLVSTTFTVEGQSYTTQSLACNGNGINPTSSSYQPIVSGIEAFEIRYGVYTDARYLQADQFYRADDMATVPLLDGKNAWSRVVSVEVCVVARGFQNTKLSTSTGSVTPYLNCSGTSVTPTDRFIRSVYKKMFAVRNSLTQTVIPQL
jgi:type IV pilus assembly protein PilW